MSIFIATITLFVTFLLSTPALADPVSIAVAVAAVAIQGFTWESIALAVLTVALGFVSQLLTPKPKTPSQTFADTTTRERTIEEQSSVSTRKIIYGEGRFSGTLVYVGTSGSDNKFLHKIVVIAAHEVEAIDAVFLDEVPIYRSQLTVDGNVTSGKYAGKVRIRTHLGTTSQDADSVLVGEVSELSGSAKLSGCAYIYVRLESDQDLFSSIPQISAWVRGKKVKEIRDSALPTQFSTNASLIIRDYLTTLTKNMGCGFLDTEINDDTFQSAANTSDEMVTVTSVNMNVHSINTDDDTISFIDFDTLPVQRGDKVNITSTGTIPGGLGNGFYVIPVYFNKTDVYNTTIKLASSYANAIANIAVDITSAGSGTITVTKVAEPRYALSGLIDTGRTPSDIIGDLLTGCAGRLVSTGGAWDLLVGVFNTPNSDVIDEDDIISTLSVTTKHSRRDRFNAVKGLYTSPINNSVTVGYPTVTNNLYETEDNGVRIYTDLDLPFTTRSAAAQRIAKIALERHRQQIAVSIVTKLTKLGIKCGDVVKLSNSRFGWSEKEFEVLSLSFAAQQDKDNIAFNLKMDLIETASAVYDWNNGDETTVDPAPNSNLPDPFTVSSPTGLRLTTENVATSSSGVLSFRLLVQWNLHPNVYVRSNGKIEIQFRKTNDSVDLLGNDYTWALSNNGTDEYYLLSTVNTNQNIILYSNDLTNAVWSVTGVPTISVGADGWNTVQDDDATASEYVEQDVSFNGDNVICSFYLKKQADTGIYPRFSFTLSGGTSTQSVNVAVNPETGELGIDKTNFPNMNGSSFGIVDVSNDRWRLWVKLANEVNADTVNVKVVPASYNFISGGVASGYSATAYTNTILVRDFDVKLSTDLTPTTLTTTAPVFADGDPGLDEPFELLVADTLLNKGTAGTLTTGTWAYTDNDGLGFNTIYLRLPIAENLLSDPNDFSTASWFKTNVTVDADSANVITAPNGVSTADKLVDADAVNQARITQGANISDDNTTYIFSVYVKQGDYSIATLQLELLGGTVQKQPQVHLTFADGTLTTTGSPDDFGVDSVGDGWFRLWLKCTNNSTGNNSFIASIFPASDDSNDAAHTGYLYAWGATLYNAEVDPTTNGSTVVSKFFEPSFFVDGRQTKGSIFPVEDGVDYDVRIRAFNYLNFKSDWVTLFSYQIGSTTAALAVLDYGLTSQSVGTSDDYGLVTDAVGTTKDYGTVG